jgi:CO dehydrogenase maturation factor
MPEIFAFAGKGGVGKTTSSGLLVRYLVENVKKGPVLAVDADPNSNLNEVLGIPAYSTVGNAREQMKTSVPAGMTKQTWIEMKVHESLAEGIGFDLLVMGRPEGQGCYCAANTLVKKHIDLLKENYPFVVVDNEAGMEHMSRLITQDVDHLFIISDATSRGIMTAARIRELIKELNLNIRNSHVVVNRVRAGYEDEVNRLAAQKGLEVRGIIHDDPALLAMDAEGSSLFSLNGSSPALIDSYGLFAKLLGGGASPH